MIKIAVGNYTVFKPKHVDSFRFLDTAWTAALFASTTGALDTIATDMGATDLLDVVGALDANSPVESAPFAKDITYSGNERSTTEDNLLGADANGTQNQEIEIGPASLQVVECTLVYRNNNPLAIFNDSTKAVIMELDNSESATTGVLHVGFNNITVLHVGTLTMTPEGNMTQKIKFSHKGGTSGAAISVTQSAPSETWERIIGGDYAEEVRLT